MTNKVAIDIRLLILKHSPESTDLCNEDADLAVSAVNSAKTKGLAIQCIGNYFCTEPARTQPCTLFRSPRKNQVRLSSTGNEEFNRLLRYNGEDKMGKFQDFVSQYMNTAKKAHDTLIIFTIGHGFPSGDLDNLGPRPQVMQALANAAGENYQRVIWWELACHACAGLPDIKTLSSEQQRLFAIVTSSDAEEESSDGVQGKIMDKVFQALIAHDTSLDVNGDGLITGEGLNAFFQKADIPHDGGGPILFVQAGTFLFGYRQLTT
jgi:hypothetical protein